MKYLKKYNESGDERGEVIRPIWDNVTEEEKKYFDLVFADYIDEGATSKLTPVKVQTSEGHSFTTNRYLIDIDLTKLSSRYRNIDQLVKYTNEINEFVLDIQSCTNKIKSEYPDIKTFIELANLHSKIVLILYF